MLLDAARAALVLVDYQSRLMPAIHDAEKAIRHAVYLARVARALGVPVVGTEQNPRGLGPNDERVRALCDLTVGKMHFNACGDGLVEALRANGRDVREVVVAGCESHVCMMQTTLGLMEKGLRAHVVPEACGSRRPEDKALAMQRLAQAGAILVSGEMVAFEWLRTCENARFKEVLGLVKELPA
jgi:nicotinamidase-related amidase